MPPKRRFRKEEQKMKCGFFESLFKGEYSMWATNQWKIIRKSTLTHPNEDLEGGTKDEMRISKALFKGVSTQFGPMIHWKVLRTSAFHLLFLLPKSSFGTHKTHFLLFSLPKSLLFLLSTFVSTFSCAFHPSLRFRGANAERATLLLATTNGSATCSSM